MKKDNAFDSTNLIVYLYSWRKPLIVFSLAAAVLAAVFSSPLFIKPKYKSQVVLFPTTTNSVSKALLDERNSDRDILEFGKEEEAEQLLQILNSDEIRSTLIKKYDLLNHYDIDPNDPYKNTLLNEEYESNVTFNRTRFMSIVIEVMDTDPKLAAIMANDIAALLDTVKNRVQSERALDGFNIVKTQYDIIKTEMQIIEDSLKSLALKGVQSYTEQVYILTEQLAMAKIAGKSSVAREIQAELDLLAEYGGAQSSLYDRLVLLREEANLIRRKYMEAKVNLENQMSHKFIVNDAFVAEKKSYPVRWLIVVLSTLGAFALTLVTIIILETLRGAKAE
ncbi:MAG: hypothetical protein ACI8P7_001173 [Candidatus Azotimanducaceae bacterium]|jgi:uncharacterized protein involved in exopolysaccharide biosynthesis